MRTLLSLLLLLPIGRALFAQADFPSLPNGLQVSGAEIGVVIHTDHFHRMDLATVLSLAQNPADVSRNLDGLEAVEHLSVTGMGISKRLGLHRPQSHIRRSEIQLEFALHAPKEAMLVYGDEATDTSIVFCSIQREASLGAAWLYRGDWGKWIHWHIGPAASIGTSYRNELLVISGKFLPQEAHPSELDEPVTETYRARGTRYGRVFLQHGFLFGKPSGWNFGWTSRHGIGTQWVSGRSAQSIRHSHQWMLTARFQF